MALISTYLGPYEYSNVDPRCKAKVEAAGPFSPLSPLSQPNRLRISLSSRHLSLRSFNSLITFTLTTLLPSRYLQSSSSMLPCSIQHPPLSTLHLLHSTPLHFSLSILLIYPLTCRTQHPYTQVLDVALTMRGLSYTWDTKVRRRDRLMKISMSKTRF